MFGILRQFLPGAFGPMTGSGRHEAGPGSGRCRGRAARPGRGHGWPATPPGISRNVANLRTPKRITAAKALGLTIDEMAITLGVSARTVRDMRHRAKGRLSREYTEKLVRVARVQSLARTIFSNDEAVAEWLSSPAPALNGAKPITFLDTDTGAREVESVLNGIAYGNVM